MEKKNEPPSQMEEEKSLLSMTLKKKRKRALIQKSQKVGQEKNKSLEKENEPPEDKPSMPLKKKKGSETEIAERWSLHCCVIVYPLLNQAHTYVVLGSVCVCVCVCVFNLHD